MVIRHRTPLLTACSFSDKCSSGLYGRLATGEVVDVGVSVQGAMQATRDWVEGSDLASACVSGGESAVYWGSFVVLGAGSVRLERGTTCS